MNISIIVSYGGDSGKAYPLGERHIIIGKDPSADIVIADDYVSQRHAEVWADDQSGHVYIKDLASKNGTFLDGRRLDSLEQTISEEIEVRIGRAVITLEQKGEAHSVSPPNAEKKVAPKRKKNAPQEPKKKESKVVLDYKEKIYSEFQSRMNRYKSLNKDDNEKEFNLKVENLIDNLLREYDPPKGTTAKAVKQELLDTVLGFGPLQSYLDDDNITEIMVNSESRIFVEKAGKIHYTGDSFRSRSQLVNIIEKIVAPLGRRVDESSPLVDARLPDGSRVNAIIPPLAVDGPCLTIRKFNKEGFSVQELIQFGAFSEQMADFFQVCVSERLNILISGGTGSGKTTLLNTLSSFIPDGERIVTIEDSCELNLPQFHVVRLESRPENIEGKGRIAIRDLVINALRMRPDRIVVGECRGGEALDMIQAMNTGHDGSLTTAHANTPRDALRRLEVMCLMAGMDLPVQAIREQLSSALQLVIQVERFRDGSRRITKVTEVTGIQKDIITMQDIFEFKNDGIDDQGRQKGSHVSTGIVPSCVDKFRERGVDIDPSMFQQKKTGQN